MRCADKGAVQPRATRSQGRCAGNATVEPARWPGPDGAAPTCKCGQAGSRFGSSSSRSKLSWSCDCRAGTTAGTAFTAGAARAASAGRRGNGCALGGRIRASHRRSSDQEHRGTSSASAAFRGQLGSPIPPPTPAPPARLERVQRSEQVAGKHEHNVFRHLWQRAAWQVGAGWAEAGAQQGGPGWHWKWQVQPGMAEASSPHTLDHLMGWLSLLKQPWVTPGAAAAVSLPGRQRTAQDPPRPQREAARCLGDNNRRLLPPAGRWQNPPAR